MPSSPLRLLVLYEALALLLLALSSSSPVSASAAVSALLHGRAPSSPSSVQARADDCRLRAFTADYVSFLAQMPVMGNWTKAATEALQLSRCGNIPSAPYHATTHRPQLAEHERQRLLRHGLLDRSTPPRSCQWEVVVSPHGSDSASGSVDSPVQSIGEALARSRQVPRPSPYLRQSGSSIACITLRAGTYYLGYNASAASTAYDSRVGGLHLTPDDSGLTIQSQAGEKVVLSGGVPLQLSWQLWKKGQSVVYASLNSSAIPALDRWHFNELYVDERRSVRAKFPNGDPAIHGLWDKVGWTGAARAWTQPHRAGPATELHISSPARLGTHFPRYQIGIGGPASVFNPPQSFWATGNAPAGDTYVVPSGMTLDAATAERAKAWSDPTTATVFAFHSGHWGSWAFDVAAYDNATSKVTFGRGGFQEARGSASGAEFYVSNVLEELDDDLEFFIDYNTQTLYFQPANGTAPTTLVASQLPCIVSMQGQPDNPVRDVSIVGVTFAHSASTYMRDYEVPSGGDWSVHRGAAVFLDNTVDALITASTFTNLGGNAVTVSNYNEGATVTWSEFVWLGESAVVLLGSTSHIDAVSNRQQPVGSAVIGNLIHELGAHIKQVAGVVQFLSTNTSIAHCAMFNMPRAGINLNDALGGGLNISSNVIFNTVRETNDHGPINSWDRQPYLTPQPGNSSGTLTPAWNRITANLLFNAYTSTWPIDHDDGSSYYDDSENGQQQRRARANDAQQAAHQHLLPRTGAGGLTAGVLFHVCGCVVLQCWCMGAVKTISATARPHATSCTSSRTDSASTPPRTRWHSTRWGRPLSASLLPGAPTAGSPSV